MPLTGDLADFPLPEVLILIGQRSGRLKILDVPFLGHLEMDFDNGEVQAMYVGSETLVDVDHMVANLGAVVQMSKCQFEFTNQTVEPVLRDSTVTITQLVISLVCYVDEQLARQKRIDETKDLKVKTTEDIARKMGDGIWAVNVTKRIQRITSRVPPPDTGS